MYYKADCLKTLNTIHLLSRLRNAYYDEQKDLYVFHRIPQASPGVTWPCTLRVLSSICGGPNRYTHLSICYSRHVLFLYRCLHTSYSLLQMSSSFPE